jgi:hypothetical protein
MRAKTIAAVLALAAIVAVALPGGAGAAARNVKIPATTYENASLKGSNGFKVELLVAPGFTSVDANKSIGHGTFETTSYSTRSSKTVKGDALDERVGSYGKFRGRFVPRSTEDQKTGCKGGPAIIEKGFYVGSFSFHGTDGFTRATAHRVRGTITRQPTEICREPSAPKASREREGSAGGEEAKQVDLNVSTRSGDVTFMAQQTVEPFEGGSTTHANFSASTYRRAGRVTISAFLFSFFGAKPSAFEYPEPHTEATITPPAPFSGSATYLSEGPKKSSWTGDLSVDLPGFGRVPLTGKKFTATIAEEATDNSGSFYGGEVQTIR